MPRRRGKQQPCRRRATTRRDLCIWASCIPGVRIWFLWFLIKSVGADTGNFPAKLLRVKKNIRDRAIFSIQKNAGIFRTLFTLTTQAGVRGDFELIAVVPHPSVRPIPMKSRHSGSSVRSSQWQTTKPPKCSIMVDDSFMHGRIFKKMRLFLDLKTSFIF